MESKLVEIVRKGFYGVVGGSLLVVSLLGAGHIMAKGKGMITYHSGVAAWIEVRGISSDSSDYVGCTIVHNGREIDRSVHEVNGRFEVRFDSGILSKETSIGDSYTVALWDELFMCNGDKDKSGSFNRRCRDNGFVMYGEIDSKRGTLKYGGGWD